MVNLHSLRRGHAVAADHRRYLADQPGSAGPRASARPADRSARPYVVPEPDRDRHPNGPVATLFLDLDGFKPVNDSYGHAAGDELLKKVAERLRKAVRPGDYVSRFGGDGFLVLCPGTEDANDAEAVAARVQQCLNTPFEVAGHQVGIGVSIRLALADSRADSPETLIQKADSALYERRTTVAGASSGSPPTCRPPCPELSWRRYRPHLSAPSRSAFGRRREPRRPTSAAKKRSTVGAQEPAMTRASKWIALFPLSI
ncbi:GGDEF domain-containing protein [Paractinoplanes maris]|uniref:GGDEF domain-containing protein n=1 Tax=Paractinoplanes maris TaxID=1734446 RepID=UPI0024C20F79|nr:GGDEF domain-containing protein [Actinoplanes maris]